MKKLEFLSQLQLELKRRVPKPEAEKALLYYSELIDDEVEQGALESDAVKRLPSPEAIAMSIADGIDSVGAAEPLDSEVPKIIGKIFEDGRRDNPEPAKPEPVATPEKPAEIAGKCKYPPIEKQDENKTVSDSWEGYFRRKQSTVFGTVLKFIGLFFFCIVAIPVFAGLLAAAIGVLVGLWAAAIAITVVGAVMPVYAIAVGVMSQTVAVGLAFAAAGFILLPIGLLAIIFLKKAMKYVVKSFVIACKSFFGAFKA